MAPHGGKLALSTPGNGAVVDVTAGVQRVVDTTGVARGLVHVFAVGSTAAVTTMEYEPGAVIDLRETLERLVPESAEYEHNRRNDDTNGHAHARAAIVGPSVAIPVIEGKLALGIWQQIVLLDFDTRPRERTVAVHVTA
jgi:secondary thiamine-phosphate synthase enzyme